MKAMGMIVAGMLWVAGWVYIHQFWHWDGTGCFIGSLPGVLMFFVGGAAADPD